jgi:hypothetical protein
MNRKYQSFIASLVLLVLFGVMTGCRETPINTNPVPRGSQFVGEINGVVRDGNTGAPLSGVTLRLIGPDGDLSTTTNADGIYVFRNLQVGTYKITAAAPSGYAPTRTRNVDIAAPANPGTGVNIVRAALDIRFFTANASLSGTLQYQTPGGQLLPVPAGTPVFVNFVKDTEPGREVTVGDVQVALVRDSVRANGAVSISGLPAVGALSQAGETPFFIVPVFTVGGVTYGNPNTGKAINYAIAGLRPGVTFTLPPVATTITSTAATLPLSLSATNMNSRTNFGTTDTIFVAFNKPINTFSFTLNRTQTPYTGIVTTGIIANTADGSLIATALPAGAVPQLGGAIVGANQAFAIRLNRPFVTGSEHRLDINVTATDGTTLSLGATGAVGARTFTTVPGIRLLSVTAGGVTLSPTTTTVGVPTSGTITFTFDRPPVGQYFTRGPLRNVRFASGSDIPGFGSNELGRVGIQGETNRIDCVGVITGNSLSFGYRSLVGPAANVAVGTIYQIHASSVNLGPADQPIVSDPNVAPSTLGNFRSAIPGDFGVVAVLSNRASEFSSFRAFTAAVRNINIPRIVSAAVPANPGDSVRITFTRPMNLSVGQRFNALSDNIRMFRTGGTAPQPYGLSTGTAIRLRISSTSSSGDTTTYFLVRDERRDVDGAAIPFEGNTAYTLEISADLTSSDDVRLGGDLATPAVFTFSGRTAGQRFASATVGGVAIAGVNTRVPTSGNIELRFTRPILQNVDYKTRGLGQNFELVRISAVGNPNLPVAPTTTDLGPNPTTIFIDATGTKTTDAITFGYRGLHRNTRYALRAISPPPADFFSTTVTLAQIPEAFYNVRWADFPNDPGVGFRTTATEYNNATGTRLDVQFVTQEAEPARLIASNTDANPTAFPLVIDSAVQTSLTNPIQLTFSKEMERNAGSAFTLTAVASPYFPTPYFVTLKATWNAAGTVVSLVPNINVNGDTARTLEAGTTYELTISGLNAVDGGALVPLIRPITFTTQPEIRLVNVTVKGNAVTDPRTFSATPGLPINAGDTVGTITLTFSKNIGGRYNVRGPAGRFVVIEDSSGTDLTGYNFGNVIPPAPLGTPFPDSVVADFVDSLSVVTNNTLTFNYRITRKRLKGRNVAENPTSDATTYLQNRIIRVSLISTIFGGLGGVDYNNLESFPNPQNIRGRVRGDLGVRGIDVSGVGPNKIGTYPSVGDFGPLPRQTLQDNIYLNDRPASIRFGPGNVGVTEFAFYFSTGGTPTSQSFPDLVISSVRNAAESVSQAAKQTVSTVRGWWKRFRGE